jgi:hypothetical protein
LALFCKLNGVSWLSKGFIEVAEALNTPDVWLIHSESPLNFIVRYRRNSMQSEGLVSS